MHRPVCLALAAALLCIQLQIEAQTTGPSSGSLMIVGGAMRDPGILQRFLDLAGGGDAPIVVIPTAGTEDVYPQFWSGLHTLKKAGQRLSVTAERIRQIQVRTLRKLRYAIHFVKPITHF